MSRRLSRRRRHGRSGGGVRRGRAAGGDVLHRRGVAGDELGGDVDAAARAAARAAAAERTMGAAQAAAAAVAAAMLADRGVACEGLSVRSWAAAWPGRGGDGDGDVLGRPCRRRAGRLRRFPPGHRPRRRGRRQCARWRMMHRPTRARAAARPVPRGSRRRHVDDGRGDHLLDARRWALISASQQWGARREAQATAAAAARAAAAVSPAEIRSGG